MNRRNQLKVLFILVGVYAVCAFLTYAFFMDQLTAAVGLSMPETGASPILLGLANAGIVLVIYGLLGIASLWLADKLALPGIYSEDGDLRRWVLLPAGIGVLSGLVFIAGDLLFAGINGFGRFPQTAFPSSLLASITAGIGEEILFRGFVFGVWAFVLNWFLSKIQGRFASLWIANIISALAFGAGHLGFIFVMTGAKTLGAVSPALLIEVLLLNGIVGLLAGDRYIKDGLVAAAGVHFWADAVFHVFWGLF